jgi:threonine dehydrogenase-like Zn-dependent dehydrogenase
MTRFVALGTTFQMIGKRDLRRWFEGIYREQGSKDKDRDAAGTGAFLVRNVDLLARLPEVPQRILDPSQTSDRNSDSNRNSDSTSNCVTFGVSAAQELESFPTSYVHSGPDPNSEDASSKAPHSLPTTRRAVEFLGPRSLRVVEEAVPAVGPGQLLVRTLCSMVSTGTELKVFKGDVDSSQPTDLTISGMADRLAYPLRYGYSLVGEVVAVGDGLSGADWLGRTVFSFSPHASAVVVDAAAVLVVPADVAPEDAVFLPAMETAVSLVQAARPLLGERVLVLGQGLIGMLTAAALSDSNVDTSVADKMSSRLLLSKSISPRVKLWGTSDDSDRTEPAGFDVSIEVTGSSAGLQTALEATGTSGRVVVGSWYREAPASLRLGTRFHRSDLQLVTSQVSAIPPSLSGRWDKARRFGLTFKVLLSISYRFIYERYRIV